MTTSGKKKTPSKTTGSSTAKSSTRKNPTQQPDSGSRKWIIIGAVALGVIGLGVLLFLTLRPQPEIPDVVTFPRPSRGHDATIVIPAGDLPPAGGVHRPEWLNCGIYDQPVQVENALHSLEHGAVWITYREDLPQEQIAALQDEFRPQNFFILSPYPGQKSPIVLTAWGYQLEVQDAADERIQEFVDRYRLGPTTPEKGAACDGGIGEPLS